MIRQLAAARNALVEPLTPTLGSLRQYEPRPLLVPAWYVRSRLPEPAPTISIVTPSLDQGRFIARAVESVLGQGYPKLEYVVRDGGSGDDTLARLEDYRSRLTTVHSGADGGQAEALNAGFEQTSGEIMAWLNADDVLLPGALAYVARWFARHPEVEVLYGNRLVLDEWDRELGSWVLPRHHPDALRWVDFVPQECTFWRRSAWERSGPLDPELRYALDWDLFRRFEADGARFAHTRRFLGGFRRHGDQKNDYETREAIPAALAAELRLVSKRWNGVALSVEEMHLRSQPYRLRSVPYRLLERALDQVRHPRIPVFYPQ